ncbi:phosphotransferase family protein [Trinickia terrae]|uniref:Phosphotransferase family protein n=1 Tax=Trinickia terrae TaxID=2571161 RepID=A0A4U1I277_9BURK|nr:phosphotransferase [Trinickia terrae]TKC87293.1 phosphotransferase family protein [Trinickia terrae]
MSEMLSNTATNTTAVRPAHRFDVARLETWLRERIDGFRGPLEVAQFSGGQSNPTYLLSTPPAHYVLRRKPPGTLLPSAHAIDREYRLLNALRGTQVPVAEPYCYCDDASVIGSEFYVMGYVSGRVLWDARLPGMTPGERRAVFGEMNRVMAALHRLDIDALGLRDYGRTGGYFERQVSRWTKQYRASETHRIEAVERLVAWLPEHLPTRETTALVHGDFSLHNLMFAPDEPRVIAVLDWELSTLGDPFADFAYLCLVWHTPAGSAGARGLADLRAADLDALGIPQESAFVSEYCRRTGIEEVGTREWNFYLAYNFFRGAAILQGITKRALDGNASSEHAFEFGQRATGMAELGWACAERAMNVQAPR